MRTKAQCLEEGINLITSRKEDWKRCVEKRFEDIYDGLDVDNFLNIAKAWKEGKSEEEIMKMVQEQEHSNTSFHMVLSMAESFLPEVGKIVQKA